MLAHKPGSHLIHMTRDGKRTCCGKQIKDSWSLWKEPLSGGSVAHDCPQCGKEQEFESLRQELRRQCAERAELERQAAEKRKKRSLEVRQAKDDFAVELAELLRKHDIDVELKPLFYAKRLAVVAIRGDVKIEFEVTI